MSGGWIGKTAFLVISSLLTEAILAVDSLVPDTGKKRHGMNEYISYRFADSRFRNVQDIGVLRPHADLRTNITIQRKRTKNLRTCFEFPKSMYLSYKIYDTISLSDSALSKYEHDVPESIHKRDCLFKK